MTKITTDYTEKATENTMCGAPLSRYRFVHWLVDILSNFMSDPVNLRDDRISRLLNIQDRPEPDFCRSLFIVDVPFSTDTRKACTTPAIMITAGEVQYPMTPLNNGIGAHEGLINAMMMYERTVVRSVSATITVVTERYDGTVLLADLIEDFLLRADILLPADGMIQKFNLTGSSAIRHISTGEAMHATDIYQIGIGVQAIGGITWTADTQGPVFRGTSGVTTVK